MKVRFNKNIEFRLRDQIASVQPQITLIAQM